MVQHGVVCFEFFVPCQSPTTSRVDEAGFARSYKLYKGIRFALVATKEKQISRDNNNRDTVVQNVIVRMLAM